MSNYSTLGSNMKRGIFKFCEKISEGFFRTEKKFIVCMVYGLLAAQSCHLTKIARELKENIALDKTVERLSRNLMNFAGADRLWENYFEAVKSNFDDETVLIIDDSDIAKSSSSKLEGLRKVRDGSTGQITDGYWYAGVSALSAQHRQPIPVYSRVYSSAEPDYTGNESIEVRQVINASKRLYGLAKFTFYAIADGLFEIFSKLYTGVSAFFAKPPPSGQLCLAGWA